MNDIIVREASLAQVLQVHNTVHEFESEPTVKYFTDRLAGYNRFILVAYAGGKPVGYLLGYDRDKDGSFYCWMVGVNPAYRRNGIAKKLLAYQEAWAEDRGYVSLKIKTRNQSREMLTNLVTSDFNAVSVERKGGTPNNFFINFEKQFS